MNTAHSLQSRLLRDAGFAHGFFTRRGGASDGPYASLNFSWTVGDSERNVIENMQRAARVLGVDLTRLYWLWQVHGREVQVLRGDELAADVRQRHGDALLAVAPGVACGVRTADCVPVLLADRRSGHVAAVHAGWRGVVADVVGAAVLRLRQTAGARADLLAAVGPHISVDAFEVGDDVAAELAKSCSETQPIRRAPGARPRVDLRAMVRAQLRAAGLAETAIDDVFGCTVGDAEQFFSYRRDGPKSGRHLSAIVAR